MQTQAPMEENRKYASSEAGQQLAATLNLSAYDKLFAEDNRVSKYDRLESQLKSADRQLKKLAIRGLSGVKGMIYEALDKLGVYSVENLLEKRGRKLIAVKGQIEHLIDAYRKEREKLDGEFKETRQNLALANSAVTAFDRYIEGLDEEEDQFKSDYQNLLRGEGKTDMEEVEESKFTIENQLLEMEDDMFKAQERREKVFTKVVELGNNYQVYMKRRNVLTSLVSKLYERANALGILYQRLKLIVGNNKYNLRAAVRMLRDTEVMMTEYEGLADAGEETEAEVVEALVNEDTSMGQGKEQARKIEIATTKRISATEKQARQMLENYKKGFAA